MALPFESRTSSPLIDVPKRVDHLPFAGQILRELKVAEVIDEIVPDNHFREVSTGTCVEAMVLSILRGSHALYRVGETLESWDLELILRKEIDTDQLRDTRLGRALDCMFNAGLSGINTAVVLEAIRAFDLDVSRIHCDTTSVPVYGRYSEGPEGGSQPDDPDSAPVLTYGHSKDKRPDLKQLIFGLTVCSDGFVPLLGRATDGNRDDNHELAFLAEQLVESLPEPKDKTLVGDCKLLTGPNLALFEEHDLNFITLMPRGWNAWDHAFQQARPRLRKAPVLRELVEAEELPKGGVYEIKREEVRGVWRGLSVETTHSWKQEVEGETSERSATLRALVVHSSALEARKRKSLRRTAEKEAAAVRRLTAMLKKKEFACEHDATSAAKTALERGFRFHQVAFEVEKAEVPAKRRRGRPKKGESTPMKTVFKVELSSEEDDSLFAEILERESAFVLVTLPRSELTDAEILEGYKDQNGLESNFARLKGPLSVAPIFLEKSERIAALAQVYVIALMVNALIQRRIRAALEAAQATVPSNKGRSGRPTCEAFNRLFERIDSIRFEGEDGEEVCMLTNMTTEQTRAMEIFGLDLLDQAGVVAQVREPRSGDRGYTASMDTRPRFRRFRRTVHSGRRRGGRRRKNR